MTNQPAPRKSAELPRDAIRYLIGLNWALQMNAVREYEKMEPKQ